MPVRVARGLSWFPMRVQNVSAPNIYRGSIAEPAFDRLSALETGPCPCAGVSTVGFEARWSFPS